MCWLAGSSSPTSGADGAAAKEVRVTPWSAGWRTSLSVGGRPTLLEVVVRRYLCAECGRVWRQDTSKAAEPRAKLSRCGLRWALEAMVVQHLTVARVAEGLGVAWNTANDAVQSLSMTTSGSTASRSANIIKTSRAARLASQMLFVRRTSGSVKCNPIP